MGWISALRSDAIRKLIVQGAIQPSLFDRVDLAEIVSPDFPGERLAVCYNPLLAAERRRTREDLLQATEKAFAPLQRDVARRTHTPLSAAEIALRAGRVVNRFQMAKHFDLTIADNLFVWKRKTQAIEAEQALDGIYVVRTSEPADRLEADNTVRAYKSLTDVERAFRFLKSPAIDVHPIRHHTEDHVRAHVLLCLLAYYVHWHLRRVLAPLLFDEENLELTRQRRDPVKPARPTPAAQRKKCQRQTAEGLPIHSWKTLMAHLATRTRNSCRIAPERPDQPPFRFEQLTECDPLQAKVFELIRLFPGYGNPK